jgi:LCP family protein required for cell wall assembly
VHLDPSNNSASLLSIPRDLFVSLPPGSIAGRYGKIDAALNGTSGPGGAANGPNNLIAAITSTLGIPINHYISINFDGFQRTIDAIGGVNMSFAMPLRDAEAGLNITRQGCQRLNGRTALAAVRARHLQYYSNGRWRDDPLSDLARIRRDHTFLRVFVNAAKAQMTDPLAANALLGGLLNQVTVDSGLNVNNMLRLFRQYRRLDPNTVPQTTLPITVVPNYHYAGGVYGDVDMPAEPLDHQVIDAWSGHPLRSTNPSSVSVQLVNISGVSHRVTTIGEQLGRLGFHVTGTTTGSQPATTTESVARYHPGAIADGLAVVRALNGAITMQPDPAVAAGTVSLSIGTAVAVAQPPTPAPPTTHASSTIAGKPAAAPTGPGIPTAGNQTPSSSVDNPEPYDPAPC